ncbi:hypothetical protein CCACVL1_30971 [Corchorus capsularis]|uniref:Uncharacterized protein n=1 Tax=Corchorus capsularis TaxID=210143 RepID=A0A1R3FUL9_COCAP|nr:hypothetical protein CCACVL1_30971 [Corchorus capsularis]
MEELKEKIAIWNILHIKIEKNDLADRLAKAGIE